MANIHPTAVVDSSAEIGADVTIGPFCVIEKGVVIGDGCTLESRVVVKSRTSLGRQNEIGEGTVLGGRAQHVHVLDPGGVLIIGDNNRIRENATVHRGYANDAKTTIGNNNLMMVGVHVAHDCTVGNNTIIVNNAMLAGHVQVEDRAYISGGVAIHQFCRVGKLAMVGGLAKVTQDVPPFVLVEGGGAPEVVGLNKVGIRRNGYTADEMLQLKTAYRVIYRQGLRWSEVLEILQRDFPTGPAAAMHEFFVTGKRGYVQERRISRKATLKLAAPPADEDASESRGRGAA
nr:acyl-ACP--UDP-N-acetylglucosamine O-acyltransferase [Pirellula staleyi]